MATYKVTWKEGPSGVPPFQARMGSGSRLLGGGCLPAVIHPVKSMGEQASRGTLAVQPQAHERTERDPTQINNMNWKNFCRHSKGKEDVHTGSEKNLLWGTQRPGALRLVEVKMDTQ